VFLYLHGSVRCYHRDWEKVPTVVLRKVSLVLVALPAPLSCSLARSFDFEGVVLSVLRRHVGAADSGLLIVDCESITHNTLSLGVKAVSRFTC
jgi:hypothetical protein